MAASASSSSKAKEDTAFYTKFGQRYPTPSPGAGPRVFYESCFKENPKSNMSLVWLIEHGVFSAEEAQKRKGAFEKAKLAMREMSRPTVKATSPSGKASASS